MQPVHEKFRQRHSRLSLFFFLKQARFTYSANRHNRKKASLLHLPYPFHFKYRDTKLLRYLPVKKKRCIPCKIGRCYFVNIRKEHCFKSTGFIFERNKLHSITMFC